MSQLILYLLHPDGTPLQGPILGFGRTGVVVQREGHAVKFPMRHGAAEPSPALAERLEINADMACESIEHEKEVYRRLGSHGGIVSCFDLSGAGIEMALMTHGNLRDYLTQNTIVSKAMRLTWLQDMARTLVYTHNRRVIVADIATRNFLLDNQLSVKLSDFTESSILPLTADMQTVDDSGYSIFTDIGQLGAVMYEVVTGKACKFDLFKDQPPGPATATWPGREDLPSTENIWLGHIIETCWKRGALQNARELVAALDSVTLTDLGLVAQCRFALQALACLATPTLHELSSWSLLTNADH